MRLNLGCGDKHLDGYINVDKFGTPDILHDLETFPWPWRDDSVEEIQLIHVLEHLGRDTVTFMKIMQELYRICRNGAVIHLIVPHPKHDTYLGDPTHVRPITEPVIHLLSRQRNLEYRRIGASNSCLALEWNVDFEIDRIIYHFDERWKEKRSSGKITSDELYEAAVDRWNVIEMLEMMIKVVKS